MEKKSVQKTEEGHENEGEGTINDVKTEVEAKRKRRPRRQRALRHPWRAASRPRGFRPPPAVKPLPGQLSLLPDMVPDVPMVEGDRWRLCTPCS